MVRLSQNNFLFNFPTTYIAVIQKFYNAILYKLWKYQTYVKNLHMWFKNTTNLNPTLIPTFFHFFLDVYKWGFETLLSICIKISLYARLWVCFGGKKKKKKSQSLSITCLQTINTRTLEKKNVLWSLWIANPRKVGGWIIQISYSCWSDFSRWKNLHFPCAGKTYPASPDIYYSFPLQIS